jgi:hypothetical protein
MDMSKKKRNIALSDIPKEAVLKTCDFANAIFVEDAIFAEKTFDCFADFTEAEFQGEVDFSGATFKDGASFKGAKFICNGKDVSFENSVFPPSENDVNFSEAQFGLPYNRDFGEWQLGFEIDCKKQYHLLLFEQNGTNRAKHVKLKNIPQDEHLIDFLSPWNLGAHEVSKSLKQFRSNPSSVTFSNCRFGDMTIPNLTKEERKQITNCENKRIEYILSNQDNHGSIAKKNLQFFNKYYSNNENTANSIEKDQKAIIVRILSLHLPRNRLDSLRNEKLGAVNFKKAQFFNQGSVDFTHTLAINSGYVDFTSASFSNGRSVTFDFAQFNNGEWVAFKFTNFCNGLSTTFHSASFSNGEWVAFKSARFNNGESVTFDSARFSNGQSVTFDSARFSNGQSVTLNSAQFSNEEQVIFKTACFNNVGEVSFQFVHFNNKKQVTFLSAHFNNGKSTSFKSTHFNNGKWVSFKSTHFNNGEWVSFKSVNFNNKEQVTFNFTQFTNEEWVSFKSTRFSNGQLVSFQSTHFNNGQSVSFQKTRFSNGHSVSFQSAHFSNSQSVNFQSARFNNGHSVNFEYTHFNNEHPVNFYLASFENGHSVNFRSISFSKGSSANFHATSFHNGSSVSFENASFETQKGLFFKHIIWAQNGALNFKNIKFEETLSIKFDECLFLPKGDIDFKETSFPEKGSLMFQRCFFSLGEDDKKVDFTGTLFRHTIFEGGPISWLKNKKGTDRKIETILKDRLKKDYANISKAVQDRIQGLPEIPEFSNVFDDNTEVWWKDLTAESAKNLTFRNTAFNRALFDGMTLSHIQLNTPHWSKILGRNILYGEAKLHVDEENWTQDKWKLGFWIRDKMRLFEAWRMDKTPSPKKNSLPKLHSETITVVQLQNIEDQYTQLKNNLERQAAYQQSGYFHYGEQEIRQRILVFNKKFPPLIWYLGTIYKLSSRYGEGPIRAILVTGGLILVLTLFNFCTPNFVSTSMELAPKFFKTFVQTISPFSWKTILEENAITSANVWRYTLFFIGQILLLAIQIPLTVMTVRRHFKR